MKSAVLPAGLYAIVPFEKERGRRISACLAPRADGGDDDETVPTVSIPAVDEVGVHRVSGDGLHLALRLDMPEGRDPDLIATTTPMGPLTLADTYLVTPVDEASANPAPWRQYSLNWITVQATEPFEVSVEGSIATIGGFGSFDVAALSDVSTTTHEVDGVERDWGDIVAAGCALRAVTLAHVARAGGPEHAILSRGEWGFDDGVLILLTFTPEMLAAMQAVDSSTARVLARQMKDQSDHGRRHIVLRPALGMPG